MKFIKGFILVAFFMAAGLVAGIAIQARFPGQIATFLHHVTKGAANKDMTGMNAPSLPDNPDTAVQLQDKDGKKPSAERKILFYRNPMNPSITSPVPAKDSMGMDYVPVYADAAGSEGSPGTVKIDPVVEQNMGVRTGMAMMREMSRIVRSYGRVTYDETRIYSIYPRFSGWLTDISVSTEGTSIRKGEVLAKIYSPELVSTQQDYLIALEGVRSLKPDKANNEEMANLSENAKKLVYAARRRLELFGISKTEIKRLESRGKLRNSLPVTGDISGTVIGIKAIEGLRVTPGTELYRVADLSEIWILADIYETDFPWIRRGDTVRVRAAALPGKTLKGNVDFIYPYENREKRTVQTRIRVKNPEGLLKPGMFVNVTIDAASRRALAVPSEAVLRTGTRNLVFVARQPGMYEPREVITGVAAHGFTEIRQGLEQGETVVISGQFLIDSESKLREATLKMIEGSRPEEKEKQGREGMDGMDMKKDASE